MKKIIKILMPISLAVAILLTSIIFINAAVYIDTEHFRYEVLDDSTLAIAGYTSDTVDDIIIPNTYSGSSIVKASNFAFQNNNSIRSVDFTNARSFTSIGMYSFDGCSSLKSIIISTGISVVGANAFSNCGSLEIVDFSGNNNVVPMSCFYNCTSLNYVRLSPNITRIEGYAFAGCTSLKHIQISDKIEYISNTAFKDDDITIHCFKDSYAHQYCLNRGIDYVLIDGEPVEPSTGEPTVEPTTGESTEEPSTVEPTTGEPTTEPTEEQTTTELTTVEPTTEPVTGEPTTVEPTTEPATMPASPDEPVFSLGDLNGDGVVDVLDSTVIQKYAVDKIVLTPAQLLLGDLNHDGEVNVLDAVLIQKYIVGKYVIE